MMEDGGMEGGGRGMEGWMDGWMGRDGGMEGGMDGWRVEANALLAEFLGAQSTLLSPADH